MKTEIYNSGYDCESGFKASHKHKKTGNLYELVNIANEECTKDGWEQQAVYINSDNELYVRPLIDFKQRFEELPELPKYTKSQIEDAQLGFFDSINHEALLSGLEHDIIHEELSKLISNSDTTDVGSHYRNVIKVNLSDIDIKRGHVEIKADPFWLAPRLGIKDMAQFTCFKKSIRWGGSSAKDLRVDLHDIIGACERKLELLDE